jgi:hypothetical protein
MRCILILFFITSIPNYAFANSFCSSSSLYKSPNIIQPITKNNFLEHSPKKATLLATFIPGAGQVYNKKYWKLPIVYGGFAGIGYALWYQRDQFKLYQNELIARDNNDSNALNPNLSRFPLEYIKSNMNFHRNNRDLAIIGLIGFYALTILDATVDAHLFSFDVDKSLSLRANAKPMYVRNQLGTNLNIGLVCNF